MVDQLIRATAAGGGIRVVGAITTHLVEVARQRHKLSYVATAALGRTMTAGLLLASSMKQPQSRVNIRVQGNGSLGVLMADAGLDGTVRGYVGHPEVELPPTARGRLDVSTAVGYKGFLHVTRDIGFGYPYSSTVELVSGKIGEDIAYYLASSEQTPSALIVGEVIETDCVIAAGGLLMQVLPKAARDEKLVETLESRMSELAGFTTLLQTGKSLEQIFQDLLGDMDLDIMPETQPLRFYCPCSFDRMLGALKLLGQDELRDMIEKDNGAEATCHFCNEVYHSSSADLERLIEELNLERGSVTR